MLENDRLSRFPRLGLTPWPTPIEALDRLSDALGGPRIHIKRDDVSGLAMGGNKLRKLEFLLGHAVAEGADVIITAGALQSNHARLTAAAAAKAGLTCHLVLKDDVPWPTATYQNSGNRLLETLMGCDVEIVARDGVLMDAVESRRLAFVQSGRKPYVIPVGGSNAVGSLGYVACALEIAAQQASLPTPFTHIFVGSGSCGTQAGLIAGKIAAGLAAEVIGVTVSRDAAPHATLVTELARQTCDLIGVAHDGLGDHVTCDDQHYRPGYGLPHDGVREAITLCARHEAILLDPVYSGKAMSALIRWIRDGRLKKTDSVLFVHTGGAPGLFAYEEYFTGRTPA